jgi:hypothetical protein
VAVGEGINDDKPYMAIDNTGGPRDGNIYVSWTVTGFYYAIMVASSIDHGASFPLERVRELDYTPPWGDEIELVPDDSTTGQLWNRPFAASGSNVSFVWGNLRSSGIRSIKIVRSTDAGETWLEPQVIAVNGESVSYSAPMVSMVDDDVFVTLNRQVLGGSYQYFMTRSYDDGVTWDSIRQITSYPESHGALGDLIAIQDHVFLTYERATPPSYREIWFMVSSDSGSTWSNSK